jgi:hypothetical protein
MDKYKLQADCLGFSWVAQIGLDGSSEHFHSWKAQRGKKTGSLFALFGLPSDQEEKL